MVHLGIWIDLQGILSIFQVQKNLGFYPSTHAPLDDTLFAAKRQVVKNMQFWGFVNWLRVRFL